MCHDHRGYSYWWWTFMDFVGKKCPFYLCRILPSISKIVHCNFLCFSIITINFTASNMSTNLFHWLTDQEIVHAIHIYLKIYEIFLVHWIYNIYGFDLQAPSINVINWWGWWISFFISLCYRMYWIIFILCVTTFDKKFKWLNVLKLRELGTIFQQQNDFWS